MSKMPKQRSDDAGRSWPRLAAGAGAVLGLGALLSLGADAPPRPQNLTYEQFAQRVVGPEDTDNSCVTCHALEHEAWQQTRHAASFHDLHATDEAKAILDKMGDRSMRRSDTCATCHYTPQMTRGRLRPSWGVSCESCHGPARDWVDQHQLTADGKAGDWGTLKKNQTPAERQARLDPCIEDGMISSTMTYDIAVNCYTCHTVPNEQLVNQGGHPAGSDGFDLVAWSQGEIRHNFASSPGAPDQPRNAEASIERRRKLYVVGALVDLELTLRALAGVTQPGEAYHLAMLERAGRARAKLASIMQSAELPGISAALAEVPETISAETAIDPAWAESLSAAGRAFVADHDGALLSGLDAGLPTEYRGSPHRP